MCLLAIYYKLKVNGYVVSPQTSNVDISMLSLSTFEFEYQEAINNLSN